jgi:hypothetical protein
MRKKIVVLWLVPALLFNISVFSDLSTNAGNKDTFGYAWYRDWGGDGSELGWDICSGDGYLYVVGSTENIERGDWDLYILKYDTDGNLIWNRTWSTSEDDSAREAIVYDGYIYVTGRTARYYGGGGANLILLKYDPQGNLAWSHVWDEGYTAGYGLTAFDNHIYVSGGDDLLKYSTDGELIWNRSLIDRGYSITNYAGNIYLSCERARDSSTVILYKFDTDGNSIWNRSWSRNKNVHDGDVIGYNGHIYLTGSNYIGNNESVAILLKFDEEGNMIWNQTYGKGGVEHASQMVQYNGSLYLFGNSFKKSLERGQDATLMKFDVDGNFLWDRIFGGRYHDYGKCVTVCEGDIYGAGDRDVDENNRDTFIVKFKQGAKGDGIIDDSKEIPIIINVIILIVILIAMIGFVRGMVYFMEKKKQ